MSFWTGFLTFHDLGTGTWTLETEEGRLNLYGAIDRALDGKRVLVEGSKVQGMGLGMTGDQIVEASSVRLAD